MTIANCPRCCEQVSVPENASREATVRCPLCQEEYSIIEALAQLPPTLIVVADVGETPGPAMAEEDGSAWSALNLDNDDTDDDALAPLGGAAAAPFEFTSGSAATGAKSSVAIRSSSRSRKPKSSPIKSMLSMVLGGLMAFPIAQLILWYLPGDLKRDFGAGPIVAQYIPAIVPARFRGSKADAESNLEPSIQKSNTPSSGFNFGDPDKFATSEATGGDNANASSKSESNRKKKPNASGGFPLSEEAPEEEPMSPNEAEAASADVFGSPLEVPGLELGGLPALDEPASPSEVANALAEGVEAPTLELPRQGDLPPTTETPEPEVSGLAPGNIRNAPQVSVDNVVQSFQAALSGNLAWDTDEATVPSGTLKQNFYQSFSKLGEALTFADRSDEKVASQIAETATLLKEIGKQSDKLAVISSVANRWIAAGYETRMTNGICLHGVVKSVEPIGDFFETTVESGNQPIVVVSLTDPSEYFVVGRQVLVLGTILDNPAKDLGGYKGSREVVVLDGFHINVEAE